MTNIIEQLSLYFEYPFVRYALIVGILVALCSSLLGVTLVLKRFSLIGDGLAHVAFGALAIAAAMNLTNNTLLVLPITIACSILLFYTGSNSKVKGDAAVAMISVGSLAIGYLVMNLFSKSSNLAGDVCIVLFGSTSILTLTEADVWLSIILSIVVIAIFILFYNKIFSITFDEDFTLASGVKARVYNLILAIVIALVIVVAMNLVGALLITALVVFPALSAMRVFRSFKTVTICAVIVSVICAILGILFSILAGTPVGATIVVVDIAGFAIFCIAGLVLKRG